MFVTNYNFIMKNLFFALSLLFTSFISTAQYREKDGLFYFKLVDAAGGVLLQSLGFESPKVAGQSIVQLQAQGAAALTLTHESVSRLPFVFFRWSRQCRGSV